MSRPLPRSPLARWSALSVAALALSACGGSAVGSAEAVDLAAVTDDDLEGLTITVGDFFGDCVDAVGDETDPAVGTTECETMRILNNKFNAENPWGITVAREAGSEWSVYYDAVNSAFAADTAPDVLFMHAANIPDYSGRGLLLPLDDGLEAVGIDAADLTEPALAGVTDRDGVVHGVPHDLHGNLVHLNTDLMAEAGLVADDGAPVLPTSPEELVEHARQFEEATGKQYIAWANDFNIPFRMFWTLVAQQGETVISADGEATVDTDAGREALGLIAELYSSGTADPAQTYDSSQQGWLNGEVGMLVNGTWVVNEYSRSAGFDYQAVDFPTLYDEPGVWANSHTWVVPAQPDADPARYRAALEYAAFMLEHNEAWALNTGHLSPLTSVLESDSYQQADQRAGYATTADVASLVPQVDGWQGAEDALARALETVWLTGADVDDALAAAQSQVAAQLD
ncbi:ABC transporter substrate-binding protein [Actinotalea sp. Marseille-Q4924]|uniref:ABC transporter substrate-binding protein n=1 Tax=Actinotalea sp. Marseille-Q4924 TaxID=2866571 RepID=UPI001CE3DAA9|nr:extracellular solute-binding protein [Actinotalea sp. Marseille-Q4924]